MAFCFSPCPSFLFCSFCFVTHPSFFPLVSEIRNLNKQKNSDVELAKFEAFLKKEGSRDISALVRGSQRLAYPIRGYWDGVYVL